MSEAEELQALEANLPKVGDPEVADPNAEVLPVADDKAQEVSPETNPIDQVDEIHKSTEIPEPTVDDIPQELLRDPTAIREWMVDQAKRRSDAIITAARQKDTAKVKDLVSELKAEDVFNEPTRFDEVKPKDVDSIMSRIPEENREELKPVVDLVKDLNHNENVELKNMLLQQKAEQRRAQEVAALNEFQQVYKGFEVNAQMIDQAKNLQKMPGYEAYTVAQLMEHQNKQAINKWQVSSAVAEALKEREQAPATEHPGGTPGPSPNRKADVVDVDSMSDADAIAHLEATLPHATPK